MRSHLLTGFLLTAGLLIAGCDKVQDLQDKIESEVEGEQNADKVSQAKNNQTAEDSTNSDDNGASTDSPNASKQPTVSNRPQDSNSPQFPDLAEAERPAAEALARAGGKLKIENGVVTELSMRYKQVEMQHMSHVFNLTHLKMLDLAHGSVRNEMMVGIDALRELQFIDLSGNDTGTETFIELLKIPSMNFMVFDSTQIGPTAFNALVRDRRKLILSLRGMDLTFTDDIVLKAHELTRRRVTFATSSGVLPPKIITYPKVAGVQTGSASGYERQ